MPMTDFLRDQLAETAFRNDTYTGPDPVYVSLYSTAPTRTSPGTEIVGNGYSRQSVAFSAASEGLVTSTGNVVFTCSGSAWPTVRAVGIVDDDTGGNIMFFETIPGRNIEPDDEFRIDAGDLTIRVG